MQVVNGIISSRQVIDVVNFDNTRVCQEVRANFPLLNLKINNVPVLNHPLIVYCKILSLLRNLVCVRIHHQFQKHYRKVQDDSHTCDDAMVIGFSRSIIEQGC